MRALARQAAAVRQARPPRRARAIRGDGRGAPPAPAIAPRIAQEGPGERGLDPGGLPVLVDEGPEPTRHVGVQGRVCGDRRRRRPPRTRPPGPPRGEGSPPPPGDPDPDQCQADGQGQPTTTAAFIFDPHASASRTPRPRPSIRTSRGGGGMLPVAPDQDDQQVDGRHGEAQGEDVDADPGIRLDGDRVGGEGQGREPPAPGAPHSRPRFASPTAVNSPKATIKARPARRAPAGTGRKSARSRARMVSGRTRSTTAWRFATDSGSSPQAPGMGRKTR